MNILLIEPDVVSRTLLQRIFAEYGKTTIAITNEEAKSIIRTSTNGTSFQLVFINMSDNSLDCKELIDFIKEYNKETKIISISEINDFDKIITGFNEECDGFIFKPYTQKKIQKLFEELSLMGLEVAR